MRIRRTPRHTVGPFASLKRVSETTVAPTGSRFDDLWARLVSTPARQRLWYWGGPIFVTVLAALLRLINLGTPHALVFDETYYVKDAWTLWNNGYESSWGSGNSDDKFTSGNVMAFTKDASYVVHPQLGKWLIALGINLFGPTNAFGWRFSVALAGIAAVWLIVIITRKLTGSTLIGVIAGGLMALDGLSITLSRVAVLDNLLMLLALIGFYFVVLDRFWTRERMHAKMLALPSESKARMWGPALWWRPWLLAASIMFGLACGIKWSGIWFVVAFGVFVVVMDAIDRRRFGVELWFSAAVLKQGPIALVLMVPVAAATYVATWMSWILGKDGYYRTWIDTHPDQQIHGFFSWIPLWMQDLWFYHQSAYGFHVGLSTPHAYQSNPLLWLVMQRPTSMWYEGSSLGQRGCALTSCSEAINPIANPLIWYAAVAAIVYLVYRFIRYRNWQVGVVLMGMVAGYLPWLMYLNRTVFSFYSIVFEPYMMIGLAMTLGVIMGSKNDLREKRERNLALVGVFGILAVILTAFFYPVWTGAQTPLWYWQMHMWLPSWV